MLYDVSHPIATGMPKAAPLPEVMIEPNLRISDGAQLDTSTLHIPSHAATHIDAPSHAIAGGRSIDQIPVDRFVGPAVVSRVRREPGELITVDDVLAGGPHPQRGDMLFLDTGWAGRFGTDAYFDAPSLDPAAAQWMVEAGLRMLAVDTVTPDLPHARRDASFDFPVHKILLGHEVLIAENLADLSAVSGRRVQAYAFPLLVRGGDAGHARIVLADDIG